MDGLSLFYCKPALAETDTFSFNIVLELGWPIDLKWIMTLRIIFDTEASFGEYKNMFFGFR